MSAASGTQTNAGPSYRLSFGGRYANSASDIIELLIARGLGRNLTKREGCLVQAGATLLLIAVAYWFLASGAFAAIIRLLTEWYLHLVAIPGLPKASPTVVPTTLTSP
jgi:hypothetical protein